MLKICNNGFLPWKSSANSKAIPNGLGGHLECQNKAHNGRQTENAMVYDSALAYVRED